MNDKITPIGTKYSAVASLCEQRTPDGTYHQRMPWPGQDMELLQSGLIGRKNQDPPRLWAIGLVASIAVGCFGYIATR